MSEQTFANSVDKVVRAMLSNASEGDGVFLNVKIYVENSVSFRPFLFVRGSGPLTSRMGVSMFTSDAVPTHKEFCGEEEEYREVAGSLIEIADEKISASLAQEIGNVSCKMSEKILDEYISLKIVKERIVDETKEYVLCVYEVEDLHIAYEIHFIQSVNVYLKFDNGVPLVVSILPV